MCDCHVGPEDAPPASRLSRRLVLAGAFAAAGTAMLPGRAGAEPTPADEGFDAQRSSFGGTSTRAYGFLPARPASEVYVRPMMFPVLPDPVLGRATWTDTYGAPRSGGRTHEGQDLLGMKMLKLLAVANATVVELRHQSAGNSLYLKGDDGWYYCYLHINNDDPGTDNGANQFQYAFAPGMVVGKRVLKGEHVAYLGDSGNAETTGSHCHFEIRMPNANWYNAAAVNAKYSLDAAEPARLGSTVPASAFAPFSGASDFAAQQGRDFRGGVPDGTWLPDAVEDLESATIGLDAFIQAVGSQGSAATIVHPLIRLYLGFFPTRIPDYNGLDYWVRRCRAGTPVEAAANQFAASTEFARTYGSLSNTAFVDRAYRNVFGRAPDSSGADYYRRRLDGGATRGWVMSQLCGSNEFLLKTRSTVRVLNVYVAMLRRSPDQGGYWYWTDQDLRSSTGLQALIKSIRTGTEYARRF